MRLVAKYLLFVGLVLAGQSWFLLSGRAKHKDNLYVRYTNVSYRILGVVGIACLVAGVLALVFSLVY